MKLELSKLSKKIEDKVILKDIDLQLLQGQCLALKGSNGSGKTTLIKIVLGLDKNYHGQVNCIDFNKSNDIGYVPQDIVLFDELSALDNLKIFCSKKLDKKIFQEKLKFYSSVFDLNSILNKRVFKLSGGRKRLINILVVLFYEPNVMLFDEPIVGLDEITINKLTDLLNVMKKDKIMMITSHREEFLSKVCDRYLLLSEGFVMKEGSYE